LEHFSELLIFIVVLDDFGADDFIQDVGREIEQLLHNLTELLDSSASASFTVLLDD
jgi:hypothetical protein